MEIIPSFDLSMACCYKSESQKIRVMSEHWVKENAFCPNCGEILEKYQNNKPVADFFCPNCGEDYELKSKSGTFGVKVLDGAYNTMIERINSIKNPNFMIMNYSECSIRNFMVIPKHFFTDDIIEKRKPLSDTARRAGWIGCNILLNKIPNSGKVFFIKDSEFIGKTEIITEYNKVKFLQNEYQKKRGWLIDIIGFIEKLNQKTFKL